MISFEAAIFTKTTGSTTTTAPNAAPFPPLFPAISQEKEHQQGMLSFSTTRDHTATVRRVADVMCIPAALSSSSSTKATY